MEQPLADSLLGALYHSPGRKIALAELCLSEKNFTDLRKCHAVIRKLVLEGLVSRRHHGTVDDMIYLLMKGEQVFENGGWHVYMREKRCSNARHINDHLVILLILAAMFLMLMVFVIWD